MPSPLKHIDDNQLLKHFYATHNNTFLGELLQRYTMLLLGVCMKYLKNEEEAKDSVQQIFLKAINEMHKYEVSYFKSWIYMVAKNHCLMLLRDKGKYTAEINNNLLAADDEPDTAMLWQKDKQYDSLAMALTQLSAEQNQCVTLFYLEKKTYQEIAADTGYSMMQVKSFIQNGKRNLKILMERMQ